MDHTRLRTLGALAALALVLAVASCTDEPRGYVPSPRSQEIAYYALLTYADEAVETLEDLVAFRTFHPTDLEYTENPEFQAMREYLAGKAEEFGLDF